MCFLGDCWRHSVHYMTKYSHCVNPAGKSLELILNICQFYLSQSIETRIDKDCQHSRLLSMLITKIGGIFVFWKNLTFLAFSDIYLIHVDQIYIREEFYFS